MAKVIYKPFGLILGVLAGSIAGAIFKRTWRNLADEEKPPKATDRDRGWLEIAVAAAVRGAVFASTRALVDRAGASAFEQVTGAWPGKRESKAKKSVG
jgi:hypothetical protein